MSPAPAITGGPGAPCTVIAALPTTPSLVAEMLAKPAANPATKPLLLTCATPGALVDHVTVRPVSAFPVASRGVAVSCTDPLVRMVAAAGVTSTEATGTNATTVMADVPVTPSAVALMVTGPPPALPVTRPLASTVAVAALPVAHVMARPVSGLPPASLAVAVSWTVAPSAIVADGGVTVIEAIGTGVTVTLAVPLLSSLVAVIVTGPPTLIPVTRPVALIVAMLASLVVQT